MQWPTIDDLSAMAPLPPGYRRERLQRADIARLIEAIKVWYPGLSVGAASCYLREDFYTGKVCLDNDADKDVLLLVSKFGDELAGFGSWEREQEALSVYARFGAIAPAHRGAKLAVTATTQDPSSDANDTKLILALKYQF